jgi:TPR repeat protein
VPEDYTEAVKWYRAAAYQGYMPAQCNLGSMYFKGEGAPQDYVQAYAWYNLGGSAQDRNTIAEKMTPEQIARGQELATELYKKNKRGEVNHLTPIQA